MSYEKEGKENIQEQDQVIIEAIEPMIKRIVFEGAQNPHHDHLQELLGHRAHLQRAGQGRQGQELEG